MKNDVYDQRKELEHFEFPVEISNIEFEKNYHELSGATYIIHIIRDDNFKLMAPITGHK